MVMVIALSVLSIIMGIVIPYYVFVPYQKHVSKNHTGSDRETLMEGIIFGFGFMCIGFIPVGIITLIM